MLKNIQQYFDGINQVGFVVNHVARIIGFAVLVLLWGMLYRITYWHLLVASALFLLCVICSDLIGIALTANYRKIPKVIRWAVDIFLILIFFRGFLLFFVPMNWGEGILPAFSQIVAVAVTANIIAVFDKRLCLWLLPKLGKWGTHLIFGWMPCMVIVGLIVYLPIEILDYPMRLWIICLLLAHYFISVEFAGFTVIVKNRNGLRDALMVSACRFPTTVILPILAMLAGGMTNKVAYQTVFPIAVLISVGIIIIWYLWDKKIEKQRKKTVTPINVS